MILEGRITELIIEGKERSNGCVLIYEVYKKTTKEEKIEKISNVRFKPVFFTHIMRREGP